VVPEAKKKPAFGSFAFAKSDDDLKKMSIACFETIWAAQRIAA